jgi:hypothetical protein
LPLESRASIEGGVEGSYSVSGERSLGKRREEKVKVGIHSLVSHSIQTVCFEETKVSGMNDGGSIVFSNESIELMICASATLLL